MGICFSLHSHELISPFLDRLVTDDEKWVFCQNVKCCRHWLVEREKTQPQLKRELQVKKVLLSVWWDCKGIIHFELLPTNATINAQIYCQHLVCLKATLKKKRFVLVNWKWVVFHQDNTRLHTAKITSQMIKKLGWEKITHSPYSPDLAPSDYHLFHSVQNHLDGLTLETTKEIKTDLSEFFSSKLKEFFTNGIKMLISRWKDVIDNHGNYIDD
ncbi:histone-lysine N-methyltransferase SETMAR-like [Octopus bimaculoides]|uniref:histone-lysine N-methyltransferase SETMAR-like n=1 Tax=Octopus bimaculoides TaxID=37653 RepID=UPI00071DB3F9|nr:histone-lysine N-methyltransferase SETMAR-like [Octopus bimaculoides]|eukprot:XP_014773434.1 PREDICTED: histone-lysine N-methyltransferase SETMAR-like [Octopus bimaculoides]